jgi:hypothetical protein
VRKGKELIQNPREKEILLPYLPGGVKVEQNFSSGRGRVLAQQDY